MITLKFEVQIDINIGKMPSHDHILEMAKNIDRAIRLVHNRYDEINVYDMSDDVKESIQLIRVAPVLPTGGTHD